LRISGQNLIPFKMTIPDSHLLSLREASKNPSEVYAIPDLLKIFSALRLPPFRSLQFQTTPSIDHPWSPLIVTPPYFPWRS